MAGYDLSPASWISPKVWPIYSAYNNFAVTLFICAPGSLGKLYIATVSAQMDP